MQQEITHTDFHLVMPSALALHVVYLVLSHYLAKAQCTLSDLFMALGAKCAGTVIVSYPV